MAFSAQCLGTKGDRLSKGIKYALWLAPLELWEQEGAAELGPDMKTWRGKLSDHIDPAQMKTWEKWLGSMAWESLVKFERRVVFTWVESNNPDTSDDEFEERVKRLNTPRLALMLASDVFRLDGASETVGGSAEAIEPVRLKSVRSRRRDAYLNRPVYRFRSHFTATHYERPPEPWFQQWLEWVKCLDALGASCPPVLKHALFSLGYSYEGPYLEHRLIQYMRTAEFILGLPQHGGGRETFARRVLAIAPELATHWYVGTEDMQGRLEKLYDHRSACVHGKIPFTALARDDEGGSDEAGQIEFLAEYIARACIRKALKSRQPSEVFAHRRALEDSWLDGSFP